MVINLFRNRNNQNYQYGNIELERLYYQLEEANRKIRNLNNRLRRVESFLGLRIDETNKEDIQE